MIEARIIQTVAGLGVQFGDALLDFGQAHLGQADAAALLVNVVVAVGFFVLAGGVGAQPTDVFGEAGIVLAAARRRAGDDQRRPRFVDEDVVHLVDDGVVQAALDKLVLADGHVVAQVVEAELAADAIGDVGLIGLLAGARPPVDEPLIFQLRAGIDVLRVEQGRELQRANDADGQAQSVENLAHPAAVAPGQVFVDRDQMDALAAEGVEVERQRGDERLAFAGAHLDHFALMEQHAAHELHVVGAQADAAARRLAGQGERLDQHVVEFRAAGHALLEVERPLAQRLIGQRGKLRLQRVDGRHAGLQVIDDLLVRIADDAGDDFLEHGGSYYSRLETGFLRRNPVSKLLQIETG